MDQKRLKEEFSRVIIKIIVTYNYDKDVVRTMVSFTGQSGTSASRNK